MQNQQLHKLKANWLIYATTASLITNLAVAGHFNLYLNILPVILLTNITLGIIMKRKLKRNQPIALGFFLAPAIMYTLWCISYSIIYPGYTLYILGVMLFAYNILQFEVKFSRALNIIFVILIGVMLVYNTLEQLNVIDYYTALERQSYQLARAATAVVLVVNFVFMMDVYRVQRRMLLAESMQKSNQIDFQNDLFSIIAHNIRTPLANISGQFDLAGLKGDKDIDIERVKPSVDQVLLSITQLLDHNKVVKNQKSLTLHEAIVECKNQFPGVVWDYDLRLGKQTIIPFGLIMAIENYVTNALRYDEAPVVDIELEPQMMIKVMDEGPGMDEEQVQNFGNPVLSKNGGLGIGVHLSSSILDRLGFHCDVNSTPGVGTVIRIWQDDPSLEEPARTHHVNHKVMV